MSLQPAPLESFTLASASPWNSGSVIWLPTNHELAALYQYWARYPLWAEAPDREFPLSAWQALPGELLEQLGNQYHLSDYHHPHCAIVTTDGLQIQDSCLPWQSIAPYWPALVAQASTVTADTHSPLMAMAIWLGRLPADEALPVYIPQAARPPVLTAQLLQSELSPATLRSATVQILNRHYKQTQQMPKKGLLKRKLRKLARDPKQFWLDSRLRKLLIK